MGSLELQVCGRARQLKRKIAVGLGLGQNFTSNSVRAFFIVVDYDVMICLQG
jgi:hypothetical protein